ncbi:Hypothetical_protein [Hexamita inflata]|uniref:Hypothetical_protein n=1 Tax=Hexamita inflata TaxID=28002 RepID=A0ABP1HB92_9EUKA
MQIPISEIKQYLADFGYVGNFSETELRELANEVQQRLANEDDGLNIFKKTKTQQPEIVFKKPERSRKRQNKNYEHIEMNEAPYFTEQVEEQEEQPEVKPKRHGRYGEIAASVVDQPMEDIQDLQNLLSTSENSVPQKTIQQSKPQPQQQQQQNQQQQKQEYTQNELDTLAQQIIFSKAYKTDAIQYDPYEPFEQLQNETQPQQTSNEILTLQQQAVFKTQANPTLPNPRVQQPRLEDQISDAPQFMHSQNYYQNQLNPQFTQNLRPEFDQMIQNEGEIHQLLGCVYKDRHQMRKARADPVDRTNFYKKCWSVQGAPQDRDKRIADSKAQALVDKIYKRREIERKLEEAQGINQSRSQQKKQKQK